MYYKDGKVFGSYTAIRNELKDISLPMLMNDAMVAEYGFIKVVEVPQPTCTEVQYVTEGGVALVDGVPTQAWNVVDMFQDTAEYADLEGNVIPAKTKAEYEAEYLAKLQAEAMSAMVSHFTDVTTAYIESKVADYNKANGLAFKDIDAFTKYAVTPTSQYNAIAIQFIAYADRLWNVVRDYQATATTVPTEAEFKAILDGVVF